jgi:hypothetical protein
MSLDKSENKYQQYLDYIFERKVLSGTTGTTVTDIDASELKKDTGFTTLLKEVSDKVVIAKPNIIKQIKHSESEDDDDDDGTSLGEDSEGDLVRSDDKLLLDDEFDDTVGEIPDGYIVDDGITEGIEDEWNF